MREPKFKRGDRVQLVAQFGTGPLWSSSRGEDAYLRERLPLGSTGTVVPPLARDAIVTVLWDLDFGTYSVHVERLRLAPPHDLRNREALEEWLDA